MTQETTVPYKDPAGPDAVGLICGQPFEVYQASPAFGVHDLDDLTPHPLLFYKKHVAKTLKEDRDSAALAFGRYFHALALEGEEACSARFVKPPTDAPQRPQARWLAAKAPKPEFVAAEKWWLDWEAANKGKEQVAEEDSKLAWRMVQSVREKPSLCALLDAKLGAPEVTFRVQMKSFQLQCRCDWFIIKPTDGGPPMDIDFKTIDRLEDFDRHFLNFGYYRQAAFYRAVMAKVLGLQDMEPQMRFLVVEKNEPFQCVIRDPDAQSLDLGWREIEHDLLRLKGCFESNQWPGEPDLPRPVSLPEWKIRQAQLL